MWPQSSGVVQSLAMSMVRGSKYGKNVMKGKPYDPKHGPANFYKGYGCTPMGHHTRKGRFIVDRAKIPQYIVPDLTGFELKAYVAHEARIDRRKGTAGDKQ